MTASEMETLENRDELLHSRIISDSKLMKLKEFKMWERILSVLFMFAAGQPEGKWNETWISDDLQE